MENKEITNSDISIWLEREKKDLNDKELNIWEPYAKLIVEFQEMLHKFELTQAKVADKMDSKQSVISRFVNMGRLPSYDFLVRLANAVNGKLGITLNGDFMATVPLEKVETIIHHSNIKQISSKKFVQSLLEKAIEDVESKAINLKEKNNRDNLLRYADFHEELLKIPSSNTEILQRPSFNYRSDLKDNVALAN